MNISAIKQDIDDILEGHTISKNLPCALAGVANSDGTLYMGAAGMRSLGGSEPMSTDTIFAIASMTKAITTVATLQLVEQGLIDLDAPITAYLPDLDRLKVLEGFDDQSRPKLSSPNSVPTTRQLLTHTSGFVYEIWNADGFRNVARGELDSLFAEDGNGMTAISAAFDYTASIPTTITLMSAPGLVGTALDFSLSDGAGLDLGSGRDVVRAAVIGNCGYPSDLVLP